MKETTPLEMVEILRSQGKLPTTIIVFGQPRVIHWTEGFEADQAFLGCSDNVMMEALAEGGLVEIPDEEWQHGSLRANRDDPVVPIIHAAGLTVSVFSRGRGGFHLQFIRLD